jgi:hypothetical protein
MPREKMIRVVVSNEEKLKAEALAAAEGMTISSYLRRCILLAPTPKPVKQTA